MKTTIGVKLEGENQFKPYVENMGSEYFATLSKSAGLLQPNIAWLDFPTKALAKEFVDTVGFECITIDGNDFE